MSDYLFSAAIVCAIQVSAVALIALLISTFFRMRSGVAVSICCWSMVAIAGLTVLFPVPMSGVANFIEFARVSKSESVNGPREMPQMKLPSHSSLADGDRSDQLGIDVITFFNKMANALADRPAREFSRDSRIVRNLLFACSCLICIGLLRFSYSLLSVRRIVRDSIRLDHFRIQRVIARTSTLHSIDLSDVTIAESDLIDSAAACGWIRPRVLLPTSWRDWSDDELHCVLAHELAHLTNRDPLWRLVGYLATCLHFFNPLVHSVFRKLQLHQELMADAFAAESMGRVAYLRALSQLALRQDAKIRCFHAGMTPVFSGFLIRRIKMLNSNSLPQVSRSRRWRITVCTVVCSVSLALFSRGLFHPEKNFAPADEPESRIAMLDSPSKSLVDPTKGFFEQERLDLQDIPENPRGYARVQVDEILRRLKLDSVGFVPSVNEILRLEVFSPNLESEPELDLQVDIGRIASVYGEWMFLMDQRGSSTKPEEEDPDRVRVLNSEEVKSDGGRNRLTMGMGLTHFELKTPFECEAWVKRHAPGSKKFGGTGSDSVFVLPVVPQLGPAPLAMTNVDEKTFATSIAFELEPGGTPASVSQLLDRISRAPSKNKSAWASAFQRIDGGLVTAVATDAEIRLPNNFEDWFKLTGDAKEDRYERAMFTITSMLRTFAVGLDLSDDGSRAAVRLRVAPKDDQKANELLQASNILREYIWSGIDEITGEDNFDRNGVEGKFYSQVMSNLRIDLVDNDDGTTEVYARTVFDVPEQLPRLIMNEIMASD